MADRSPPDPRRTRAAVLPLAGWLRATADAATANDTVEAAAPTVSAPPRAELAAAVRLTARTLAAVAPGASVEVRIPPFAAVQCISGPTHTRGTPPNVVETEPRTWLLLATGLLDVADAAARGLLRMSGSRAGEVADWLPLLRLDE